MPGRIDNQIYLTISGQPEKSVWASTNLNGPFSGPRDLGKVYNGPDGRRWQKVKYAATLTQAAVASNIVYWKDVTAAEVDTDLTDSAGSRNTVAGVIEANATLPTAGQFAFVLQEADSTTLNGAAVNFQAGGKIIASSTVGVVTVTAQATAAVDNPFGTVATAVDRSGGAGTVVCDIDIPSRLY